MADARIYQVAVPAPLYRIFDYLAPEDQPQAPPPGVRVRVPFGRREAVGVLLGVAQTSTLPRARLKRVQRVLDVEPVVPAPLLKLLIWAADYYHHPIGEVIQAALPALLRQGRAALAEGPRVWALTPAGRAAAEKLGRAPAQKQLYAALMAAPEGLDAAALAEISPRWSSTVKAMRAKGWVSAHTHACLQVATGPVPPPPRLNPAQQAAVAAINAGAGEYHCHLLHGVTGSGKTEVYLHAIEQVLARGRQALVLVPEIGLTPQLVGRFQRRFRVPIAVLHSGLTDQERLCAWLSAGAGKAPIVLGTRSAVFTPFKDLGLIVVDEEHDTSYKQQDGFRYSARDCAIMRAAREKIPIVLGSATPSLESLKNARAGTYRLLELPERTGSAAMPAVRLLDMRRLKPADGLSHPLRQAIADRLGLGRGLPPLRRAAHPAPAPRAAPVSPLRGGAAAGGKMPGVRRRAASAGRGHGAGGGGARQIFPRRGHRTH